MPRRLPGSLPDDFNERLPGSLPDDFRKSSTRLPGSLPHDFQEVFHTTSSKFSDGSSAISSRV
ncbi:hypothetical protein F2Q70_00044227 [Brassica cretica]|uniref:Uncharacterized protein n=1 Tax=Brassica cretica TaxID=69181 RepID=A0A8S9KIE8_BRACR|nr:hypothetical protein F2Q68_00014770 [Brassica cretica]KAF2594235.1 hypothetical protein F2Q70_00044227 [Brassica cretica]